MAGRDTAHAHALSPKVALTRRQLGELLERCAEAAMTVPGIQGGMLVADIRAAQEGLRRAADLREPPPGTSRETWLRASEADRKRIVSRARG